uniref:BRISC and BRCA1-A complex member 2 n=1 Tax=Araucaria cunninghamii TaxID=56994 RepID=A0A0D6QZI3_ARACU
MTSLRMEKSKKEREREKAILERFHPLIAPQIDYLLNHSLFPMKIDQVWSGSNQVFSDPKNLPYADRFSLLIPCCLDYIKWDVVYNAQYPSAAPDIIFGPDDESFQPLSVTGEGQEINQSVWRILCDWKVKDASALLKLILELRLLYMGYQRKRVEELDDPRLKFEISTIIFREGVEICLLSGSDNAEEVKFAVPLLSIDLSKVIPGYPSRHQSQIFLQVIFPVRKRQSSVPSAPHLKLVASTTLNNVFDVEDVKLPVWVDGMCMAEYIPTLEDNLKAQVSEAIMSVTLRRQFIEALVPYFGRPLEAETVFCRRVSLIASAGAFTFLVHFILPIQFPKQQPTLTLQSSQHFDSQGMPITSRLYTDIPWSPRWDVSQMAQRIFDFIADECINFKQYCSDALQLHR